MARQSKTDEMMAGWRALAGHADADGWRSIPIAVGGPCRVLAARRFPGNEEALLVGFSSVRVPAADQLPQGRGFHVSRVELGANTGAQVWIGLSRQAAGSLELFTLMADDVIGSLASAPGADEEGLFHAFVARIRAWQDFMRRRDGVLSPEAEVGLFGEIVVLQQLLLQGVPATVALDAWQGPLDGVHDFRIGVGAIEVKSTATPTGFPATIGSLEQLDDSLIRPIFVAGVRLAMDAFGLSLPELAGELRDTIRDDAVALAMFDSRLVHAGLVEAMADRYTRRFNHLRTRFLTVCDGFPRLTRANVALEIRKVRYELDLDLVCVAEVGAEYALAQLGVT